MKSNHVFIFAFLPLVVACGSSPPPAAPAGTSDPSSSKAAEPSTAPTTTTSTTSTTTTTTPSTTAPSTAAPSTAATSTSSTRVAKEGESCGDGSMGTPNAACAPGLVCDKSGATKPPAGAASSGPVGTC